MVDAGATPGGSGMELKWWGALGVHVEQPVADDAIGLAHLPFLAMLRV